MDDIPIGMLLGTLVLLVILSAFFSASETAMMALNRYRLKHLADNGHRSAQIAYRLLQEPDRLLGTVLFGNNLVNISAASVASIIAWRLYGDVGIAFSSALMTIIILVFAEVPPKTVAANYPERIAFPLAMILAGLVRGLHPVVWLVNHASGFVLRLFSVSVRRPVDKLSAAELHSVIKDSGHNIPESHQSMLLRVLELENVSVNDVMVPRSAIEAVDLNQDTEDIMDELATSHHTRVPLFEGSLDQIVGILHLRDIIHLSQNNEPSKLSLKSVAREPMYIPEDAKLTQQLLAMQAAREQMGLVVDEYGDLKGLITVEEILEEIVGEFTRVVPGMSDEVHGQPDGSYLVDAATAIRDLNRRIGCRLPTDGPKTLNGLILEYLEDIPHSGTSMLLAGHPVEIVKTRGTAVTVARLHPALERPSVGQN